MTIPTQHPLIVELRDALSSGGETDALIEQINASLLHPPLWGARQVAEHLGISHTNLYKLKGLPDAVVELPRGRLWDVEQIKAFQARKTGAA